MTQRRVLGEVAASTSRCSSINLSPFQCRHPEMLGNEIPPFRLMAFHTRAFMNDVLLPLNLVVRIRPVNQLPVAIRNCIPPRAKTPRQEFHQNLLSLFAPLLLRVALGATERSPKKRLREVMRLSISSSCAESSSLIASPTSICFERLVA